MNSLLPSSHLQERMVGLGLAAGMAASAATPQPNEAGIAAFEYAQAVQDAPSCSTGLVSFQTNGTLNATGPLTLPQSPFPRAMRLDPPKVTRLRRMRRRVLTGARLHVQQKSRWRPAMLTLTYRVDAQWNARHISEHDSHGVGAPCGELHLEVRQQGA
jgi:hypothetical protein